MNKSRTQIDNIFGCLSIVFLIMGLFLAFANTGIAAQINKWQSQILGGEFYPALTAFVLIIIPLLVLMIVKLIVVRIIQKRI